MPWCRPPPACVRALSRWPAMAAPMPIEAVVTSAVFWRSPRMCRLSCRSPLRLLGWWDGIGRSV